MVRHKNYNELTFTDDFMFWKILTTNEELCKKLIEIIIGEKVHEIKYLNGQEEIAVSPESHGIRLDVLVDDGKIYDLEMQTTNQKDLPLRIRYYQGVIDLDQLKRGAEYKELRECYIIFICTFDPFGAGIPKYTFRRRCEELDELYLDDESSTIIVNGASNNVAGELGDLIHYIATGKKNVGFTTELDSAINKVKNNKELEAAYMLMSIKLREQYNEGRNEGREVGLVEGRAEGRAEGERQTIYSLISDGDITISCGAKKLHISENELLANFHEAGFKLPDEN